MTWKCTKCRTNNRITNEKCSWCGAPKPEPGQDGEALGQQQAVDKLRTSLHDVIEKLDHRSRVRLWAWMEDNII